MNKSIFTYNQFIILYFLLGYATPSSTHNVLKSIPSIGQNVFVILTVKEDTGIDEFTHLLNFYVQLQERCDLCSSPIYNFPAIFYIGDNDILDLRNELNITDFLNDTINNSTDLETWLYNARAIGVNDTQCYDIECPQPMIFSNISSTISDIRNTPETSMNKNTVVLLSNYCPIQAMLQFVGIDNSNLITIVINIVMLNKSDTQHCSAQHPTLEIPFYPTKISKTLDKIQYEFMNDMIYYNYDILQTPINIFFHVKLGNLGWVLNFISNYLMNSELCKFGNDPYHMNTYYINYQIEIQQGIYLDSDEIIPWTTANLTKAYLIQRFNQIVENRTNLYKNPCDSSAFNNSLSTIFNSGFNNGEQFNVLITDVQQNSFCTNLSSLKLTSKLRHFDFIFLRDQENNESIDQLKTDFYQLMGKNAFLSDRSNHIYFLDISKSNSSSYNEISVCQQSLQSGAFAFKTYKTKKSITWIIIVSSIAALLVVSGVAGAGYYIYHRRKEDAREDLISKMLVELQYSPTEIKTLEKTRDKFLINEKKLQINFENPLGKGFSSIVYKGHLTGRSPLSIVDRSLSTQIFKDCDVAVKVPTSFGHNEVEQLTKEIDAMKRIGYHPRIISLLGWCMHNDFPYMVLELSQSDLLIFAKSLREMTTESFPYKECISYLWQITKGMRYIVSKNIIHRDLAARNILLMDSGLAKISDFGLCCTSNENCVYRASLHKKLPVRWVSIEALTDRLFSEKSDVWSFGIILYEVFSRGTIPYATMSPKEMYDFLQDGHRLEKPLDATDEIYEIMLWCWKENPEDRPTFKDLTLRFRKILEESAESYGYLENIKRESCISQSLYKI